MFSIRPPSEPQQAASASSANGMSASGGFSSADKGIRIIGVVGILLGIFYIVYIVSFTAPPIHTSPDQQLSTFNTNQASYTFLGAMAPIVDVLLIVFVGGFSRIVRQKSPSLSSGAAFLVVAGALTDVIDDTLTVGSLNAISQAPSTASYATDATYLAAFVSNFVHLSLEPLSIFLISMGMLLFAWVVWKGEVFPKWLSYVVLVGGLFGAVSSFPVLLFHTWSTISIGLGVGYGLPLIVWGFVVGTVLLRRK